MLTCQAHCCPLHYPPWAAEEEQGVEDQEVVAEVEEGEEVVLQC